MDAQQVIANVADNLQLIASVGVIWVTLKARRLIKERRAALHEELARDREYHEELRAQMAAAGRVVLERLNTPVHCPRCGAPIRPPTPTPEA